MKNRRWIRVFVVAALAVFGLPGPLSARDLYVSPTGTDAGPGTLAQPFATLARAQRAARQVAAREPVTVYLRAGTYSLPETLVFTPEDYVILRYPEHSVLQGCGYVREVFGWHTQF